MKKFSDFTHSTTVITEDDIVDNAALAERRLRSLVRDAKRDADDATKSKIDNLATDITEIIHDWCDDDISDIENDVEPSKHTPLEKLMGSKYGTFADAVTGFGLKFGDDSAPDKPTEDIKKDEPRSIFVVDGKETEWFPSDTAHELLARYFAYNGQKVEVKTPDGLLLPYCKSNAPAPVGNEKTDSSNPDVGNIIKVEINGKLRRALTIKYGKDKILALVNQAKTKAFKSYDDADDSDDAAIWCQIVKKSSGIGRDGQEVFNFALATKNPIIRPYRG